MDRLRPRKRKLHSGFTNSEVEKLENYFKELGEESLSREFCAKVADAFSCSGGRAGKPKLKWNEIQGWLQNKHQELLVKAKSLPAHPKQNTVLRDDTMNLVAPTDTCSPVEAHEHCPTTEVPSTTQLNINGYTPGKAYAVCLTTGIPSSSELNESTYQSNASSNFGVHLGDTSTNLVVRADARTPLKVQEPCLSTQIPAHSLLNKSTHRPNASSSLVVHADACTSMKAHEQWVIEIPSRTQIKEITHYPDVGEPCLECPDACIQEKAVDTDLFPKAGEKFRDLPEIEFEARSSKDGAWYDVERILTHRILSSGEAEVRVRYEGYGAEEDEWVNVKNAVRERSVPVEHSECYRVKVGDLVLCFQERKDQAIYYDARVVEILRRMHDIRGCRCIFLIRYDHDRTEERVRLRRICRRPT
ncbi:hypothetical protein Dimus_010541 [Dionaea muscipula]